VQPPHLGRPRSLCYRAAVLPRRGATAPRCYRAADAITARTSSIVGRADAPA
jgi:hypothetical protein